MALEVLGVVAGGAIGLLGGLGGVFLGHLLARKRDSATRAIEGLKLVVNELNRFSRLGLFFEQQINLGLRNSDVETFARDGLSPEWMKATHELQETNWRFPCMAYLPEAMADFYEIDRLMLYVMDPYARAPTDGHEMSSEQAWKNFKILHAEIQAKVESRLKRLL